MTHDFENHHIVPETLSDFLRVNFNIDADTYAGNRLLLPVTSFAGVPPHGNRGNHTHVRYTSGLRSALENITNNVPAAQRQARVDQLMAALRIAIMRGDVDLFGPGSNSAKNNAFFAASNLDPGNPNSYLARNAADIGRVQTDIQRFAGPNGVDTPASRLVGYSDAQLAELARRYPSVAESAADLYAERHRLSADFAGRLPPDFRNRLQTFIAFVDSPLGQRVFQAIKQLGFVGDLIGVLLIYNQAEELYRQGNSEASNRLWAGFAGELLGGLAGAAAGLVAGPFAAALSIPLSIGGAEGVKAAVLILYDNNADFRNFLGGVIQSVRESVAGLPPETAQRVQAQIPNAISDILVQGEASYTFRGENGQPLQDSNGEYILRIEYDGATNTLRIDRPGTANDRLVPNIDLEGAGEELREILIEQEMKGAPIAQGGVENASVLANLDLPNGAHFQNISLTLNGESATYRIFRATAPDTSTDHEIVVTAALYSVDGRTWYYGPDHEGTPGDNWTISVLTLSHPNGSVTVERVARVQPKASSEEENSGEGSVAGATDEPSIFVPFAQIGAIFGSNLARLIPTDELWQSTLAGTLLGTLGLNIGQAIERAELLKDLPEAVRDAYPSAFANLPTEFVENLLNAGAGVVSSILVADLVDSLGLDGTLYGDWLQTEWSAYVAQIITHLPEVLSGNFSSLAEVNPVNLLGGFLGSQLAAKLVDFETIGGQIGAAIGSTLGTLYGAELLGKIGLSVAGPVGAFIGAFIGYIFGGLIGSLFGGKPKSGAGIGWSETEQEFLVANVWSKNGGSKEAARAMAGSVASLLNGVISASGSRVADAGGVQVGAYDTKGKDFIYKVSSSASYAFRTRDIGQVITHGQFIALSDLSSRLVGGNVFVKRAVLSTLSQAGGNPDLDTAFSAGSFDVNALLGNISTGQDYGKYIASRALVEALIAADPEGGFAGTWLVTLARAAELGLNKRATSDWLGGWNAFFDQSVDGAIDGTAPSPGSVVLELDGASRERLFFFFYGDGSFLGYFGDTIDTASKDHIVATAGADTLAVAGDTIALTTSHTLNGAAAVAGNRTIRVAALIDGAGGNDTIRGGDLGNDVIGGDGNDVLGGGKLDDWLLGGAGDDRLFAANAANIAFTLGDAAGENAALGLDGGNGDYLEGGAGADALYGSRGSDWLNGGDGADRILGGAGGDILQGGAGDERGALGEARILGGAGSDQYVFGFGDGKDVIFDESDPAGAVGGADAFATRMAGMLSGALAKNWAGNGQYLENGDVKGGEDAISFGPGITLRNLVMKRSGTAAAPGADLIIQLANDVNGALVLTGDEITIKDWFTITRRVEWLRFADGEQIRIGDMTSFIAGTSGPDVIIGTFGADFMVGDGGNDQLRGLAGNDYGFGGGGNDFVAGDSDNDLVAGGSGADEVIGGSGNDTVFGDDGADDLYGGAGNDILAGGLGDDQVVTGAGNDIVRFERGDGRDTLIDEHVNNWDVVWQNGAYLNGYTLQSNGTVTLAGVVVFDGQQWLGRYDWDDVTKTLRRHKGAVAGNVASNSGFDTIEFGLGVDIQDIVLRRIGNDAVFAVSNGESDARLFADIADQITIKDWFTVGASIEQFVFTETGSVGIYTLTGGTDGADAMTLTAVANWATGGLGDDTIIGANSVDMLAGGLDQDILRGGAGADVLMGGAGDDVLEGGAGIDQLIGGAGLDIASYAASATAITASLAARTAANGDGAGDVYQSIEGLEGSTFADKLTGDGGNNVLRGLAGGDTLTGGAGDDSYEYEVGHGADIVRDGLFVTEQVLDAAGGFNATDFTAVWTLLSTTTSFGNTTRKYRLVVTRNGTGEQVYVSRDNVDFVYVNQVQATAPIGTAWPFANSQWKGGFARTGNGVQTTRDFITTGEGGVDTIQFGANISLSDLVITRANAGADLVIGYGVGDSVTVQGQNNAERRIDAVLLRDGLEFGLANLRLVGEAGGADSDVMFGDAANNTINGLAGNDVISGAAGNDALIGGAGDDAFEGGAGADSFDGGTDSITDGVPLAPTTEAWGDTIRYVRSTAGVIVNLSARTISGRDAAGAVAALGDAVGDSIIVSATGGSSIENVTGSDGYGDTITGDARANRLYGLGGADTLTGNDGDDVLAGGAGDDSLTGGLGEDALIGEDGNDTLSGGDGKDMAVGGTGNDTLNGDAGDDTLVAGDGNDTVFGHNDNDNIAGEGGDDVLNGGAGNDEIVGGLGADQIFGGDGDDTMVGSEGADILTGGLGDDIYSFDAASGADSIIDPSGVNTIVIGGIGSEALWLVRVGTNLILTAIGKPGFSVTLSNYFGATSPSRVREIVTDNGSLFLNYGVANISAEPLINAMTAASASTPATMPAAIAAMLAGYWETSRTPAPRVSQQNLSMTKAGVLSGSVNAIDHDANLSTHIPVGAGASFNAATGVWTYVTLSGGVLALNQAAGTWTFTPAAAFAGNDSFVIKVTDNSGNTVEQTVSVFVRDPSVNYAPNAPTIAAQPLLNVQEGAVGGLVVATLAATDPNLTTPTLRIASDPGNLFEIVGNQLRFRAGKAVSYATLQTASVEIEAVDSVVASGLVSATRLTVGVGVLETNHAPILAAQSLSVTESTPGAGQVVVATLAPSDPDLAAVNRNFRYQVLSGDTSVFSVDEMTGQVRLQGALDYETRQLYTLQVKVWDGGALGSGLSSTANINFNITNVNEAPQLTGATVGFTGGSWAQYYHFLLYMSLSDPEGDAISINLVRASSGAQLGASASGGTGSAYLGYLYSSVYPDYQLPYEIQGLYYATLSDPGGAIRNTTITITSSYQDVLIAPIVLDLDGDGLELSHVNASGVRFDQDGDGEADPTGWVGADDGLLVIDHNGNGVIDNGGEIAFSNHVDFAVSDLEGLRGYDTNENGQIDAGDAAFAALKVWQDANQDGVSQAGELTTLAERNIASIGLTLTPTVQGQIEPLNNVIYGTSAYVRADGAVGTVGDVMLAWVDASVEVLIAVDAPPPSSGSLAPIVLDLDGDGVSLIGRDASMVAFDANGDKTRERTGWFGPGDGVLAFDRNFNGAIDSGLEISFLQDVVGAMSDLEGLASFDSNNNGAFDKADTWFGAMVIWNDANQDGTSQKEEMSSLAANGIVSINLTRRDVRPNPTSSGENAIIARSNFVRADGSVGEIGDVMLAYGASPQGGGAEADRTSDTPSSAREEGGRGGGGGGSGGGASGGERDDERGEAEPIDLDDRRRRGRNGERPRPARERGEDRRQPAFANFIAANDSEQSRAPAAALGAPRSALHSGLGVMDRKLLGMIDAMAQFEASSSADLGLGRRRLDPRVAELLTALPDIR